MTNKKKQTMWITVNRGIIVRNILNNTFFDLLQKQYRVILFVAPEGIDEVQALFPDVDVVSLKQMKLSGWKQKADVLLTSIGKALMYNPTIEVRTTYGLLRRGNVKFKKFRSFIQKYIFAGMLSHIPGNRAFLRIIDNAIFSPTNYQDVETPDMVFVTNIADLTEIVVLREAKRRGAKTVAMAKSWDNTSKFAFREKVDHFVAWSEYMKEEAIQFQKYQAKNISVVGVPQFDQYRETVPETREAFLTHLGLDPQKKTIFFGAEGPVADNDPYIAQCIADAINNGELANHQLLIRPHFGYKHDAARFAALQDHQHVIIDTHYTPSSFRDGTELSKDGIFHLMMSLQYSDAVVTSASTLVLDAMANGKYPLLYQFDKQENTPMKDSVKRLYKTLWFQEIGKMGLNHFVHKKEELVPSIKKVIAQENELYLKEREATLNRFCYQIDGKSGERLFRVIQSL